MATSCAEDFSQIRLKELRVGHTSAARVAGKALEMEGTVLVHCVTRGDWLMALETFLGQF